MLDIVCITPASNITLCCGALDAALKSVDIPYRLVVSVDGGNRMDMAPIEGYLKALKKETKWSLTNEGTQTRGFNECAFRALDRCEHEIVAFIAPQVRINDPSWVSKMQMVFDKDPVCGIVDTIPGAQDWNLPPWKREVHDSPMGGCMFWMARTKAAKMFMPRAKMDTVFALSRTATTNGFNSWCARSVSYSLVECKKHELWVERVEAKKP